MNTEKEACLVHPFCVDAKCPHRFKRFKVVKASGLYRDKPNRYHPMGRPYHKPVYLIWDTKIGKHGKENGMLTHEEDKAIAEAKAERLNEQEDF